jgi:hypothetical protein
MLDLDLCNDCHQSVGIPCILVYRLYVKGVSYLVGKCGGQISPGSTGRRKDLTKGPRAQWIIRSLLHGPGEEQSVKQIDIRPDWCKPGWPTALSKRPQQGSNFPALEPHATEPGGDRSAES